MAAESLVYFGRPEKTDLKLGIVLTNKYWSHQYHSIFREDI